MLDFLINRNKLVHLYYNMEFMKDKLRGTLQGAFRWYARYLRCII